MKVKDLMSTSVVCVRPETSITQVAKQMRQADVGSIPVCDDKGHILGIITDRDIVIRALSEDEGPKTAKEIMTQNPISISPNMNAHQASMTMAKHQVRRLPVVENNKLTGMLSLADIARKNIYVDEAGDALSAISKPGTLS
ncbi:MAG: CBS domain-containing protein [Clostridiales bacterium]|nr:CBS domain-containing protein [Clostridiales bacterium]